MHDDIIIHSKNWGVRIIGELKNKQIGLLGVIGSHIIDKATIY